MSTRRSLALCAIGFVALVIVTNYALLALMQWANHPAHAFGR